MVLCGVVSRKLEEKNKLCAIGMEINEKSMNTKCRNIHQKPIYDHLLLVVQIPNMQGHPSMINSWTQKCDDWQ